MVTTARLPDDVRQSVADQIAQMLPADPGLIEQTFALAESLPVRSLSVGELENLDGPLRPATSDLGQWHHQVTQGDNEGSIAATSVASDGSQSVVEVATPAYATAISRAVTRLDEHLADDPAEVELLVVPAYYIVALLLSGEKERVLVVDRPGRLSSMEVGYLYPSADFVETLRRYPPSFGVPDIRTLG